MDARQRIGSYLATSQSVEAGLYPLRREGRAITPILA